MLLYIFSSWQQKPNAKGVFYIDDDDRNGFMSAICGMDKSKGLDLILHTPGGETAATQSIVNYLYNVFGNDIRVIVPHTAMSAGTMIACASKEIIMAKHSNLGPIDPQYGNVPANEYKKLFENAMKDLNNKKNITYWQDILKNYPPMLLGICNNVIDSTKNMVKNWLTRNMLKNADSASIDKTVDYLSNYELHLQHNNRLDIVTLQENTDLNIKQLEDDPKLQDMILTLYHCYHITASTTNIAKIIENHKSKKFIKNILG